jgi:Histidine kinase-, DNA gyrase B-, and HSP90-like ATPase
MARKCFMCGHEISQGILCEKCDKPRKTKPEATAAAPPPAPAQSSTTVHAHAHAVDPFPKAPILPFPVESVSPAVTSVVDLLIATGAASILLGPDKSVKFVSDTAKSLFDASQADLASARFIEEKTGARIGDLSVPSSSGIRVRERNIVYSLVPMSGGAGGAVLIFRPADPMNESQSSFVNYVRETVLNPLRSLREVLSSRASDPLIADTATTVEQVLSSLELAPGIDERKPVARPVPGIADVVRRVADRFMPYADLKGIKLQVDVPETSERFADHDRLAESLAILMDNALHYVPASGQVVVGLRSMEHKGKPLLLFFVMDNGSLVPEALRQVIFDPSFVWNAAAPERTGRGLFKCREFSAAHGGSVWVESKSGKACTFFLRVRPD